jgi:2-polyprenyl-3-methyl-5-hydroxy-6-metoxy-1,4-benzoquinol methylase
MNGGYDGSDFWDRYSMDFDSIYTHDKSKFQNFIDSMFRWDMYERFKFTMDHSQPVKDKSILDVGCGSGYYSLALAKSGAKKVIGIDYSRKMIQLANERLKEENLQENCEFHVSAIMDYRPEAKFDISIAIGLFDYIQDPLPVLEAIKGLTRERIILSFPRMYTWRAPVRKIRLMTKNLDVYFYSRKGLSSLFTSLNLSDNNIVKIGKLHCVAIDLNK